MQRLKTGKTTVEVAYGITSLTPPEANSARLLTITRTYWGIENGLHYRRDVTFREDATRFTNADAAQNMAILNNLTLGLLLRNGERNTARARRKYAAQPERAFKLVL